MIPSGETLRTTLRPPDSEIKKRLPEESTATPAGDGRNAAVAGPPSPYVAFSGEPPPATVVIVPSVATLRTRPTARKLSAIYRFPAAIDRQARGSAKFGACGGATISRITRCAESAGNNGEVAEASDIIDNVGYEI
jgi:hypothetical protein